MPINVFNLDDHPLEHLSDHRSRHPKVQQHHRNPINLRSLKLRRWTTNQWFQLTICQHCSLVLTVSCFTQLLNHFLASNAHESLMRNGKIKSLLHLCNIFKNLRARMLRLVYCRKALKFRIGFTFDTKSFKFFMSRKFKNLNRMKFSCYVIVHLQMHVH